MYLNTIPAYVYKIRHIPSGQYYFGFRKAHIKVNRTPEQDFLIYYYSSSKVIRSMIKEYGINQFDCSIIYQDTNSNEAFWYEQDLIKRHWNDPLMINKQYRDRFSSKGVFLSKGHTTESKLKISKAHKGKIILKESIEKMVATRTARGNYKHDSNFVEKMLSTKMKRYGTLNSNTPESRAKSRQTKMDRYGVVQPKHTPETIEKLKKITHTQEQINKCLETKRQNGTMNSNTPETIAKRKESLLKKYGTLNTREIARLKKSE